MKQFVSFQTVGNRIVIVNKATITYVKQINEVSSMIFFNSMGQEDKVQALRVNGNIKEVLRILNGE